ncbi:hypothetical protein [Moorella sulfitireducens (nom. illeg.)]|uniref:hypothetical protein n=1 Tax=Neomoorella sulfitireducens TaxID=2972948 RepID=UPI0021ACE090|nr:hypothetical protein [Moorella sulfitireducens]
MTLATCNRRCACLNENTCGLSAIMEPGQPFLCPYRHHEETALTREAGFPAAGLPRNFATVSHARYPGTGPAPGGGPAFQGLGLPPGPRLN